MTVLVTQLLVPSYLTLSINPCRSKGMTVYFVSISGVDMHGLVRYTAKWLSPVSGSGWVEYYFDRSSSFEHWDTLECGFSI